jgi:hypothetical protein
MEFSNKHYARLEELRAETVALHKLIEQEKKEFMEGLKVQGWTEVLIPEYNAYGESYSGIWILFAPTVSASVIETARSEGCCFEPEEAGLKPEEFYW